jgi:hypothetical protein
VAILALSALVFGCSEERPTEPGGDAAVLEDGVGDTEIASSASLRWAGADSDFGVPATARTYEIVIENLTLATGDGASQPFSPPVLATHSGSMHLFQKGQFASSELAGIAEDAMNGPMLDRLRNSARTFDVVEGAGVILPGSDDRFEIKTAASKTRLSVVFMLVNTNDAFGGIDAVHLPPWGERVYYLYAYDAGSEENTELTSDIPGPCCGSPGEGTPTHERITKHRGILGVGDLDPGTYGWSQPIAKLTVRRIQATYEITVENLTPATVPGGSQVFSPPVLASHSPAVRMFRVGGYASDELSRIAEDGDKSGMVTLLNGLHEVHSVVEGDAPIFPGGSATYEIEASVFFARLSMAFMLVNTNDGFSGVDRLRLPFGHRVSYYVGAYDAGSEENTELASDIPGPCCGNPGEGTDEHRRIREHPGILGIGDLDPSDYAWADPAAKLTITRIK